MSDEDYLKDIRMIKTITDRLDLIDFHYDSKNDDLYNGSYRKVITYTDVNIANDFSGIVITPRSVILEENVDFAGMIIAGDRIYIQGNNNIVADVDVMRSLLREEVEGDTDLPDENSDPEAYSENGDSSTHLKALDYIGHLIKEKGIQ